MHKYTFVSVAGATGYSGAEAVRLLARHPHFRLNHVYGHSSAGTPIDTVVPSLSGIVNKTLRPFDELANDDSDALILALPHTEALTRVPGLIESRRIVDMSGDFRLHDVAAFHAYYKHEHTAPQLLGNAAYGLSELYPDNITAARLVANPGCYATVATLALAPLAHARLLPECTTIIAYSGVSGAGRVASPGTHFAEVNESVRAYKVGVHQHTPEIEQTLSEVAGSPLRVSFIPHLLPVTRGIHVTITIPVNAARATEAIQLFRNFYADKQFVRLRAVPPELKDALYTKFCDIHATYDSHAGMLIVLATIDNLVKGAAGQAIQNLNLMFGLDERSGLI